jgi:hypothetical protein
VAELDSESCFHRNIVRAWGLRPFLPAKHTVHDQVSSAEFSTKVKVGDVGREAPRQDKLRQGESSSTYRWMGRPGVWSPRGE